MRISLRKRETRATKQTKTYLRILRQIIGERIGHSFGKYGAMPGKGRFSEEKEFPCGFKKERGGARGIQVKQENFEGFLYQFLKERRK